MFFGRRMSTVLLFVLLVSLISTSMVTAQSGSDYTIDSIDGGIRGNSSVISHYYNPGPARVVNFGANTTQTYENKLKIYLLTQVHPESEQNEDDGDGFTPPIDQINSAMSEQVGHNVVDVEANGTKQWTQYCSVPKGKTCFLYYYPKYYVYTFKIHYKDKTYLGETFFHTGWDTYYYLCDGDVEAINQNCTKSDKQFISID